MSRITAPVGDVTTAIARGSRGIGRFLSAANRPSAASLALSCSKASWRAPRPTGSIAWTLIWNFPCGA